VQLGQCVLQYLCLFMPIQYNTIQTAANQTTGHERACKSINAGVGLGKLALLGPLLVSFSRQGILILDPTTAGTLHRTAFLVISL